MNIFVIIALFMSFLVSSLILPSWIKKARRVGLMWEDMNKFEKGKVAGSGGIAVITGFILGLFLYVAIQTFFLGDNHIKEIFAVASSILILAGVGIIDDLLGWKLGGLSKKFRLLMCIFASIPLMVLNVGNSVINIPLFGKVSLGILYPLFFIPLGITGAATTFNFLAGFNGLEAGQGIILLSALSLVAYLTGSGWIAFLGICMISALISFYFLNKVPARVFPGDVLTYPLGGLIAMMAILGNFERIAVFFFIPYILEVFLKLRGRLRIQSFGEPQKDGTLEMPYKKVYGVEHLSLRIIKQFKGNAYERDVVCLIHGFQLLIIVLGFLIFREYLFV